MIFKTNLKRKKYSKPIIFLEEFHEDGGLLAGNTVTGQDSNPLENEEIEFGAKQQTVDWGNPFEIGD